MKQGSTLVGTARDQNPRTKKRRSRASAATEVAEPSRALSFMRLLWPVAHALESTSKRMLATLGITGPQRLVLRIVGFHGRVSAGQLARELHIHPSSLSGMLRRLERAGLLARRHDPDDGRRAVLSLTAAGKRMNSRQRGTVEAGVQRALEAVSHSEVLATERMLRALAIALENDGKMKLT